MDPNHVKPTQRPETIFSKDYLELVNITSKKLEEVIAVDPDISKIKQRLGNGICWAVSLTNAVGFQELLDDNSDIESIHDHQIFVLKRLLELSYNNSFRRQDSD